MRNAELQNGVHIKDVKFSRIWDKKNGGEEILLFFGKKVGILSGKFLFDFCQMGCKSG